MKVALKSIVAIFVGLLSIGMFSCELNKISYTEDDAESVTNEAVSSAYLEDATDLSSTAVSTKPETTVRHLKFIVGDVRFLCADVMLDEDSTSTFLHPKGQITVDFGSGCADKRGSIRTGKILISYEGRRFLPSSTISLSFDGYAINGVSMTGTHTLTNSPASTVDNPVFSIVISNAVLTWPDGKAATRDAKVTREWIRTPNGVNDEWIVTGQATGTNRNGKEFALTTDQKLEYQKICQVANAKFLPSTGKETLVVGDKKIDIDFGSGSCDQQATVSINGKSKSVDLSKSL
jgi:hypothetical protein